MYVHPSLKNAAHPRVRRVYPDTMRNDLLVEATRLIIASHRNYSDLAKEMGLANSTIGNWVNGTTRCARTDTLEKALRALGCKLAIVPEDSSNTH